MREAMRHDRHGLSLADLASEATQLIRARWGSVSVLADVLMARGWLSFPEVRRILGARYPASPPG